MKDGRDRSGRLAAVRTKGRSAKREPSILMLGTSLDTMGGIAAVLTVYRDDGLFVRWPIEHVVTHRDGGAAEKFRTAVTALFRVMRRLVGAKPKLMHLHVSSRASFWRKSLFMGLAIAFRVPYLLHLHGSEFQIFYGRECGTLRRAVVRYFFRRAAWVIVLSEQWGNWVRGMCPDARIRTVYNPVILPARPTPFRERDPLTLLFLGRLGERKGTYDLLHAIQRLQHRFSEVKLLLGGDGDIEKVRALAAALGISRNVELLGWVGSERKRELLARCAVYVLPSYNEGLPMSVLEAMAAGLPIVSTTVGGIPEAVRDGVEGFIAAAGDLDALTANLRKLLDAEQLRERMGDAARARVEREFSSTGVLPRIETIYRSYLESA